MTLGGSNSCKYFSSFRSPKNFIYFLLFYKNNNNLQISENFCFLLFYFFCTVASYFFRNLVLHQVWKVKKNCKVFEQKKSDWLKSNKFCSTAWMLPCFSGKVFQWFLFGILQVIMYHYIIKKRVLGLFWSYGDLFLMLYCETPRKILRLIH